MVHRRTGTDQETRTRISRAVIVIGLVSYAGVLIGGEFLPEWSKDLIFLGVALSAIAADAWELGFRTVIDRKRWWRVVLLSLIAVAGVVWLVHGRIVRP